MILSPVISYSPAQEELCYSFGGCEPVRHVDPDTVLRVDTEDCFGGRVRNVDDLPSQVCEFSKLNPVSGPFFVNGAEPGDILAIHIADIAPTRPQGFSSTFPLFGALTTTHVTPMLHQPLEERVWCYDLDPAAGTMRYQASASEYTTEIPFAPMIGTIGVAPASGEVRLSTVPDLHGGNLDTPLMCPGTTLYLPVNVPGALFALGDGHARQGDGELCGVGVEIATRTTIGIALVKGVAIPGPRLETETAVISVGCGKPLEDAYRVGHHDLVMWTAELTGLDVLDSYQLISQVGTAPIGNVVDATYTVLASVEKRYLRDAVVFDGVHRRLRELVSGHI